MRFYRTEGPVPNYERTQGDAKATTLSFGPVDVDTSHAGITAFIKEVIDETVACLGVKETTTLTIDPVGATVDDDAPPPPKPRPVGTCPSCHRASDQAKHVADLLNRGDVGDVLQGAILDMKHGWELDKLEAAIKEVRARLAPAPVNPPARKRPTA